MDRTLMETEKQKTNEKRQQLKFKSENIGLDPYNRSMYIVIFHRLTQTNKSLFAIWNYTKIT